MSRIGLYGKKKHYGRLLPLMLLLLSACAQFETHEAVDLGLPSGVLWATCNLGADSPSDYGDYYAWGEIATKETYTTENNKTAFDPIKEILGNAQYDAAKASWGGGWRLPSQEEIDELVTGCRWVWTTEGGHKGYRVTGPNGNSIFLPAAGHRDKSLVGGEVAALYWSGIAAPTSVVGAVSTYCYCLRAMYGEPPKTQQVIFRADGIPIRPVTIDPKVRQERQQQLEKEARELEETTNGHDYVDLGLPSGVKWATCNLGASSPSGYGDLYAWGETTDRGNFTKDNSRTWLKERMSDFSGDPQYDPARAHWGGKWRMPTREEIRELYGKCRWTPTAEGNSYGYRVTGPNGNSIFLPARGYKGIKPEILYSPGRDGCYWSSTPGGDNGRAYALLIDLEYQNDNYNGVARIYRFYGCSIRPVFD